MMNPKDMENENTSSAGLSQVKTNSSRTRLFMQSYHRSLQNVYKQLQNEVIILENQNSRNKQLIKAMSARADYIAAFDKGISKDAVIAFPSLPSCDSATSLNCSKMFQNRKRRLSSQSEIEDNPRKKFLEKNARTYSSEMKKLGDKLKVLRAERDELKPAEEYSRKLLKIYVGKIEMYKKYKDIDEDMSRLKICQVAEQPDKLLPLETV